MSNVVKLTQIRSEIAMKICKVSIGHNPLIPNPSKAVTPLSENNKRKTNLMNKILLAIAIIINMVACTKNPVTPDTKKVPTQVTGVSITPMDQADSLTWTVNPSSDNVTSYTIYAGTSSTSLTQVGTTSTNSFKRTGLTNGTTYYYQVAAVNAGGEGPKSNVLSSTPQQSLATKVSLSIAASVPGSMKVLPWRYYDPTSKHFGNPYIDTDTFKIVYQARVTGGFDSMFVKKIIDAGTKLPAGTTILQDLRLPKITGDALNNYHIIEKQIPRIGYYSDGIPGQYNYTTYGVADTIPVAVELNGQDLVGKSAQEVIGNVHLVVFGNRSSDITEPRLLNKIYDVWDFVANNTAVVAFDKKTPTIYTLGNKWYLIFPVVGTKGGSKATTTGNSYYTIRITFKDGSKLERTVFAFE
jgi:hypothetical protein